MQPVLSTPRLTLRPLAADDHSHLTRVFAGAEVRRYLFDNEEVPPATIVAIVEESLSHNASGLGLWLIRKGDGVIGCVGRSGEPALASLVALHVAIGLA